MWFDDQLDQKILDGIYPTPPVTQTRKHKSRRRMEHMKHRRPYMLRYVAQIKSANEKDFFEITFEETNKSGN